MIEVDARGLSCPIPVVKTKKAFDNNPKQPVAVLVDDATARENVWRLGQSRGYTITIESVTDGYRLSLHPSA